MDLKPAEKEGGDELEESFMKRLVAVASMQLLVRRWGLHQEAHDHVRARGVHGVRQVLADLVQGEVELASTKSLDAEPSKLDEGLLVLGRDLVRRLQLALSPDYVLADQVLYQAVVNLGHLLRELLVLSEDVAEQFAEERAGDETLVGLVLEQKMEKSLREALPVLEVVLHKVLDTLPVEALDGDDLGELVNVDRAAARTEGSRRGEYLRSAEAEAAK